MEHTGLDTDERYSRLPGRGPMEIRKGCPDQRSGLESQRGNTGK